MELYRPFSPQEAEDPVASNILIAESIKDFKSSVLETLQGKIPVDTFVYIPTPLSVLVKNPVKHFLVDY